MSGVDQRALDIDPGHLRWLGGTYVIRIRACAECGGRVIVIRDAMGDETCALDMAALVPAGDGIEGVGHRCDRRRGQPMPTVTVAMGGQS